MYTPTATFLTPADSAHAVGNVYSVALVATIPLIVVLAASLFLQWSNAGTRAILWRCTLVGLLAIYAGRLLPWQWMAWVLPELLARPLITLGTVQLDGPPGLADSGLSSPAASSAIRIMMLLYWTGVALILFRTIAGRARLAVIARRAMPLSGGTWTQRIREAGNATGVSTHTVRLLSSAHTSVPLTWGLLHPVILLPQVALRWPADRIQAVLRHELVHVGARDSAMRLVARIACALFWFHPGVWWLSRRFTADAEAACDDRVLLSGVRPSDYAEWLAASVSGASGRLEGAMALAQRGTLRARLATITDTRRRLVRPGRGAMLGIAMSAAMMVAPLSTARLAPTRDVLTSLMLEARWESRAWAVVRLAQRADSIEVARSAARHDPDPAVRAWARYALDLNPVAPVARPRS